MVWVSHVVEEVLPENVPYRMLVSLTRVAAYVLKPPVSLKRLSYVSGSKTLVYKGSRHNPGTGRNFTVYDCQEFLALLLVHVPHKYECRIRYYGAAASTARRQGESREPELLEEQESGFVPPSLKLRRTREAASRGPS